MLGRAIQPEILEMIEHRRFDALRELIVDLEIQDVAEIVGDLTADDQALVFRVLPYDLAADVFENLDHDTQEKVVSSLRREEVSAILNAMSPDDRTHFFEELPSKVAQRLLNTLNPDEYVVARTLLGYPEDSIGRLMTPEYISAEPAWSVEQTMAHIREVGGEAEIITYIYVVDERGRLLDDVHIARLVMAKANATLSELADETFVSLSAMEDREEAVVAFKKYDRVALPVVDTRGVLLGIVTVDDVLDVGEEEASEDIAMFGGQAALEDSYFHTSNRDLVRKRAGWLTLLFVGGLVASVEMEYFGDILGRFVLLAAFIPLVLSSGGNSGSQSASMIIRGLAIQELDLADWKRVFRRELTIGFSLGVSLGLISVIYILVKRIEPGIPFAMVSMISVTMIVTMGALCGALMPFFFKRIGVDPAVSSGPFIATFIDLTGIFFYLTIATIIMG